MFAGTGALGWESASRGARRVTMIERQPRAAQALRELQARLQCPAVEVVQGDALQLAARMPAASLDLVFVDPPYDSGLLPAALAAAARLLRPEGLVYVESARPLDAAALEACRLEPVRAGRAGAVHFHLLRALSC
jgi:16S rRNA G966 N2-methylase RsmD